MSNLSEFPANLPPAPPKKELSSLVFTGVLTLYFLLGALFIWNMADLEQGAGMADMVFCLASLTVLFAVGMYFYTRFSAVREPMTLIFVGLVVMLALFIRIFSLDYATADYWSFLTRWVDFFRENGGIWGLKYQLGDYNVSYLYFLSIFSYLPLTDLYLIKILSIIFDMVLALGVMKLVSEYTTSQLRIALAFVGTLIIPTVWLNSGIWGQCDSIYAAFAVWGVYCAVKDRPLLTCVHFGLAFCFKLQAVFILPVLIVLLMMKKMKLRHLLAFPATYMAVMLPSILLGKPIMDVLTVYLKQTGTYSGHLVLNAPSVYALVTGTARDSADVYSRIGIMLAGAVVLVFLFYLWSHRERLTFGTLPTITLIFCLMIPWLLPHMHDRYFFMADIFAFVLGLIMLRRWMVPLVVIFASYAAYHQYLMVEVLIDMRVASVALLGVLILLISDLYRNFSRPAVPDGKNALDTV